MWHYLDPAAIYNPTYEQLRSEVSEVLSGSSSTLLDPKVNGHGKVTFVKFLLGWVILFLVFAFSTSYSTGTCYI